ncbi:RELT-like protein 2 isoform 3-T7 [Discoglossus pictus]
MAKEVIMEEEVAKPQQSPYMLFLLVLVFFITGLVGFLICHVLKKKGYRCRTSPEELDPETKEPLSEDQDNTDELSNEDTVERIVKCIIQNEANAEALKQMLGDTEGEVPTVPRFRVTHIGKKSSLQGSQDDTNISSDPLSSDKEDSQGTKPQNGLGKEGVHEHGKVGLPLNGPEEIGLAKLEIQKDSNVKSVENHALKRLENNKPKNKDRRSSAPEQSVEQRERIDILEIKGGGQNTGKAYVAENKVIKQVTKEDSAREQ